MRILNNTNNIKAFKKNLTNYAGFHPESSFAQHGLCANISLPWVYPFLGDFWAFWERDIFFLIGWLNWRKYEMMKIWWIWKIEIWSEEFVDGHQTVPYQLEGGQLSGSVPTFHSYSGRIPAP